MQGFFHITSNAQFKYVFLLIPVEINANKFLSGPIYGDAVQLFESIEEVVYVIFEVYSTPKLSTTRVNLVSLVL